MTGLELPADLAGTCSKVRRPCCPQMRQIPVSSVRGVIGSEDSRARRPSRIPEGRQIIAEIEVAGGKPRQSWASGDGRHDCSLASANVALWLT
jgi:hypothetical protein